MTVRRHLLDLAGRLADLRTRREAARELARELGAEDVLVFLRDAEVGVMITAPGMRPTLPEARQWQRFLQQCVTDGEARAELPVERGKPDNQVMGIAPSPDAVFVLIGTHAPAPAFLEFRYVIPLLGAAMFAEQLAVVAQAHARVAAETAVHADALARSLDNVRRHLETANDQLRARTTEVEEANEMLQDQAGEMEAQTAELEAQTEELARANVALEQARREADAASRAKSEFLTTMSHELRTPLNAISGYTELLLMGIQGPITDLQRDALERITRSQRHLLRLINEVLSLARIEAGHIHFQVTDVTASDAIVDLLPLIEPQLAAKNLHYHVELPDTPVYLRADREKLAQILLNLASNAIKFTPPGGHITLRAGSAADDDTGFISVTDTGRGIPEDRIKTIFDPFVQVESGLTRTAEGTGLGLAISQDLVEGMHGRIEVASVEGEGSTFTVRLPRSATIPAARTETGVTTSASGPIAGGGSRTN